jgi:glycine/D-amino acid oxidase-like deaminating enzyme
MSAVVGWDVDPVVAGWSGCPVLDDVVTADACVIGLGGSGLAAVDDLLERGLSVVGVDAGRVAAGAAGRNGGFLLGGGAPEMTWAMAHWGAEQTLALYRHTLAELDRLLEQLGPAVIRRVGSIRLAGLPGDPRDEDEAADRTRELEDCAFEMSTLSAAGVAVQAYDGELGRGLFLPQNAVTNPARRVLGLAQLATSAGARLFEHSPVRSVSPGVVTTERGTVRAGVVIVAVDGRLELLLPQLGGRVRTARLQMLATAPGLPARLPCAVYGRWGYDYAQQDADGRILVGGGRDRFAEQEWTMDTEPTTGVQAWIEDVARRMAGRPVDVAHRWAASVGYTADGKALCTRVDDGVVACGGYSGTGNLVGPVAARAAVALALDAIPPPPYFSG